jgi:pimeloyl-ACP methyl ester carboxylesterase
MDGRSMPMVCASLLLLQAVASASLPPAVDTLLDVGGYRMHLVVHRGTRPITVVMESGGGASLEAWSGVETALARRTGATVVAYDRAGFGRSDLGAWDLTPRRQMAQLDDALDRLGTPPDRIVVGHSYGGVLATLQAHLFPRRVRGLVLVDPMNVRFVAATGDFLHSTVPHIEHPSSANDSAVARMVRTFDGLVRDTDAGDAGLRIPVVVITAGDPWWKKAEIDRAWRASHEAIAQAGPRRRLLVADRSDHDVPGKRPDTIVEAVLSLIDR